MELEIAISLRGRPGGHRHYLGHGTYPQEIAPRGLEHLTFRGAPPSA